MAAGNTLILEAFDKDTISDDLIGKTQPIKLNLLVENGDKILRKIDFLDKKGAKIGHVTITTQYVHRRADRNYKPDMGPKPNQTNIEQE